MVTNGGTAANGDVIDFAAEVEALLKTGATGATLASLTADTAIGTALNNTNNIRTTNAANGLDLLVQIDLNGDGVYARPMTSRSRCKRSCRQHPDLRCRSGLLPDY